MKPIRKCFLCLISATLLLNLAPSVLAAEDLRLEGISYDAKNPKTSLAAINGEFVSIGDTYGDYKIVEITAQSVRLSHLKTNQEKELRLTETPSAKVPVPSLEAEPQKKGVQGSSSDHEKLVQALREASWNPFSILERARETALIADLKKIHTAAMVYLSEHDFQEEVTLKKLVEAKLISRAYEKGVKGNYQFHVASKGESVRVHADPLNAGTKSRHYFIDEHSELFVDIGKPATDQSAPYEF